MKQKYSSKDTSINVVNKVYKQYDFQPNSLILDYGGGKYDANIEYMKAKGVTVLVYDKYNRSETSNNQVLSYVAEHQPNYIVCSNVLNVILEDEIIDEILRTIQRYDANKVIFAIYEGNRSGVGQETSKGYQRNQKTKAYVPMIEKYFTVLKTQNGLIECRRKEV